MLKAILNISLKEQSTKIRLYGNIPPLTCTIGIRIRRTRFAGHFYRSEEESIKDVLLWTLNYDTTEPGRPRKTYM